MASAEFQTCPGCGRNIKPAGTQRICLYCGTEVPAAPARPAPAAPPIPQAPARPGTRMPVPPPGTHAPAPAPAPFTPIAAAPPPAPAGAQFPERMRANKALAGRICMGCNKSIELGENVWNCQTCSTTMHQACHDTARACLNMQCPTRAQALAAQRTGTAAISGNNAAVPGAPGGNPNEKPCPYCGEKILASAKKCRFCGEYLNPADRKLAEARKASSSSDDNLTGSEIIFGILCGTIACIVGIVWMIQGKKKGGKLVGIAFISAFVQGMIRAMLER